MDFAFTPEQIQLADSVRRVFEKDYDFETRKRIVASADGTSPALWAKLVDLGLTALPMPEAAGGFDGSAVDLLPVMREFGRGLVAEAYFATVFAAEFVKRSANCDTALLAHVADGSLRMSAALGETASRHDLLDVATVAQRAGDGFRLSGTKRVVAFGAQADRLVVSARVEGGTDAAGDDGFALFVVDARAPGIDRRDWRTLDGQRVADIGFANVDVGPAALLASGRAARALLARVVDYGIALLCAEALGAMEALNAATLDYAKTRRQFGQPIARFQVLQHRMVDMFVHLEQARSMAYLAAARAASDDARERGRIASAAKVRIGQAARFVGQQAVQIHGGMGVTNELPAAHLFKRLTMIEMTLGDTDHHLQRFIALSTPGIGAEVDAQPPMQRAA